MKWESLIDTVSVAYEAVVTLVAFQNSCILYCVNNKEHEHVRNRRIVMVILSTCHSGCFFPHTPYGKVL